MIQQLSGQQVLATSVQRMARITSSPAPETQAPLDHSTVGERPVWTQIPLRSVYKQLESEGAKLEQNGSWNVFNFLLGARADAPRTALENSLLKLSLQGDLKAFKAVGLLKTERTKQWLAAAAAGALALAGGGMLLLAGAHLDAAASTGVLGMALGNALKVGGLGLGGLLGAGLGWTLGNQALEKAGQRTDQAREVERLARAAAQDGTRS